MGLVWVVASGSSMGCGEWVQSMQLWLVGPRNRRGVWGSVG